jgi:hypothetical protein
VTKNTWHHHQQDFMTAVSLQCKIRNHHPEWSNVSTSSNLSVFFFLLFFLFRNARTDLRMHMHKIYIIMPFFDGKLSFP